MPIRHSSGDAELAFGMAGHINLGWFLVLKPGQHYQGVRKED